MTTENQGMDDLDFSHAEMEAGDDHCVACHAPLQTQYFDVNGKRTCVPCGTALRDGVGTSGGRVGRALLFGLGAAAVCSLVWWGIREATGYELGLIAIAVGWLVGIAVRNGSGHRGGAGYQALAILLTYSSIAVTYIPLIVAELTHPANPDALSSVAATLIAVPFAFAMPVLQLFEGGVIGFFILLFALYEAWKLNQRPPIVVQGPFDVAAPPAAPA